MTVDRLVSECNDSENAMERKVARNAFKAHVFLLKWFMTCSEKEATENQAEPKVFNILNK